MATHSLRSVQAGWDSETTKTLLESTQSHISLSKIVGDTTSLRTLFDHNRIPPPTSPI